ncbi:class I SAM-dependent methyltransferase [Nocardia sp. NPDC052566]|uniref:class I SAM-dependent methyltransferase n=1 Tax=Nocardia sp. NPDC052566 TaxID=3364330 RepID=UPI0037C9A883
MPARWFYNFGYRHFRMPWEVGPRDELVDLVVTGRLRPCRVIDLGCGSGANAIYLADKGFDVTGLDFSADALTKAMAAAAAAGVSIRFIEDDLTGLRNDLGTFDLLIDYSVLDDLSGTQRDSYTREIAPLARPGAQFLLWCFEWPPRRWERWIGLGPMAPGEVERRFGGQFTIERVAGTGRPSMRRLIPGFAAYLMTKEDSAAWTPN